MTTTQLQPASTATPLRSSQNIQGNVLAAFNKNHQQVLLVTLPADTGKARRWLTDLLPLVSNTKEVEDFNDRFSRAKAANGGRDPNDHATWVNVSVTSSGLSRLAHDGAALDADLQNLTGHRRGPSLGSQLAFLAGPVSRADALGDTGDGAPGGWLFGADGQPGVDAVVTVAADRRGDLDARVHQIEHIDLRHGAVEAFGQAGAVLPGPSAGHEHFGFKDGISQPGVAMFHRPDPANPGQREGHPGTDLVAPGEFVLGYPNEDGTTVPAADWLVDGSFLVLRRLEQDVAGFWEQVRTAHAGASDADQEKLAAGLVGRWRSGASLAHFPTTDPHPGTAAGDDNDFDYQGDDPLGAKTPRAAHIRKVYPRDAQPPNAPGQQPADHQSELRRIMRRGIPFGAPFSPTAGPGAGADADRGLVFACYQASIDDQFEFLQSFWANNSDFPAPGLGIDCVIGAGSGVTVPDGGGGTSQPLHRFVRTAGSVYAFTPSRATLGRLARGQL